MRSLNTRLSHSVFSNPRIRVDIKNEAVSEEDASQSAVALSRVSTLLREVRIFICDTSFLCLSVLTPVDRKLPMLHPLHEDCEDDESK